MCLFHFPFSNKTSIFTSCSHTATESHYSRTNLKRKPEKLRWKYSGGTTLLKSIFKMFQGMNGPFWYWPIRINWIQLHINTLKEWRDALFLGALQYFHIQFVGTFIICLLNCSYTYQQHGLFTILKWSNELQHTVLRNKMDAFDFTP